MNYIDIFKKGGIHIKKENRGKFTDYCGGKVTEECIQKGKNSPDPKIRKRATFAQNARHFKHQEGGKAVKNPWYAKATVDTSTTLPRNLFYNTPVVQQQAAENNDFDWEGIKLGNNPVAEITTVSSTVDNSVPRGLRNNNPLNIIKSNIRWDGKIDGNDATFETFATIGDGYAAALKNLKSYINQGHNTISSIIAKWAPPSDNNPTSKYITYVAEQSGIDPNTKIDPKNQEQMMKIVAAMSQFENGKPANWDDLDEGWKKYNI